MKKKEGKVKKSSRANFKELALKISEKTSKPLKIQSISFSEQLCRAVFKGYGLETEDLSSSPKVLN